MASEALPQEPCDDCCGCDCGDGSTEFHDNYTPQDCPSSAIGSTLGGTTIGAKLDTTAYFQYTSDKTKCPACVEVPRKGSSLTLGWVRLGGQEAAESAYADGWKPAGAGSVFTWLPRVNLHNLPDADGRRVYSEAGTLAYDQNDQPQGELPILAKRDTTYFTEYHADSGVYFEYFAGSSLSSSDARYGRVNRRYDTAGNELRYHYTNNAQGKALLRSLTNDIGGELVPYFHYADETIDATHYAPLTKIHILDKADAARSRTVYFDYENYEDTVTFNTYPYLKRITNPANCVVQYDPVVPFNDISDVYQMKREVDQEGYQTYFTYTAGKMQKVVEPEGRVTYYEYPAGGLTKKIALGRTEEFTLYDTGPGTAKIPLVTRRVDALGNATYYTYDATLARVTKKIEASANLTYFDYVGGGAANKYAPRRRVSAFNNAVTYYGYDGERYDLAKRVGPRHTSSFNSTTYYRYDAARNRTAMVDALGRETLYGHDVLAHLVKERNALGNTAYFNYSTVTGNLDSQADAEGNTSYFGYSSFRNLTRSVSPRWTEGGFQAFATYFDYDQLDRKTKEIDPFGKVTYFDWTSRGDLLAQVDARGTDRSYTYDGLRRQTQETVTDALGVQLTQTKHGYDIYGNRTKTRNALGNATYFFYDQIDRQTVQTDALQKSTYFYYDKVGNRTHQRDARGNTTYYFYDRLARNTVTRDALANSTYYFYDLGNNRTEVLDPRNNPAYFFYDELERVQATRDALANPTYFYFDEVGNQSAIRDARFNSTYFFYDKANRRTKTRDALGKYTYFTYDAAGNVTRVTDARGNSSVTSYDALNRPKVALDALGNAVTSFYDAVGNRLALDRGGLGYGVQPYGTSAYGGAPGATTYFFYDGLNRNTAIRDALANLTYFFYDGVSNRTATRNPLLHLTYFGYDAAQRLTRVMDPLLKTTYFEYDAVGNQTKVIDPRNNVVHIRYDKVNRTDAIRFGDGGSAYFFYDQTSNQTRQLDPRGNTTYYGYDVLNRAARMMDQLGKTVYFEYDPVSNLSKEIGGEKESSSYTYDALNRRANITFVTAGNVVSAGLRSDPYYVYDEVGNLVQMGDLWGLHRMGFDAADRMSRHQYPNANSVYFEYDARSNVMGTVYPGAAGRQTGVYDALDRQTRLQAPSGATAYFAYDADSKPTQRLLGNSARTDMTYDAAERAATWRASNAGGSPLTYFDYTRDAKGLITKVVREATHTVYYAYDAADRLTMEIWSKSGTPEVYGFRYAYDGAGNRIRARINGQNTYYFYDRTNQLTVKGTNALFASPTYYTYDKNGSLTDLIEPSGTTKFAYNAAGLVARMRWRDASSTYFFYDGLLRRYAMIAAGSTTPNYFLWEGLNLLQEQNADGTVKEEHTNAQTPIAGIAQLVETNRPGQPVQKIYPIMDPRGTITKWIQSDGTTVLASREYDAFGTIIPGSAVGTWPGRFGYQGQAWIEILSADGGQRLLLSPVRLYDPMVGRFTQRDPIIKRDLVRFDVNPYSYSRNVVTLYSDPSGLLCCCEDITVWFEGTSRGFPLGTRAKGQTVGYGIAWKATSGGDEDIFKCHIRQRHYELIGIYLWDHKGEPDRGWRSDSSGKKKKIDSATLKKDVATEFAADNPATPYGLDVTTGKVPEGVDALQLTKEQMANFFYGRNWMEYTDTPGWAEQEGVFKGSNASPLDPTFSPLLDLHQKFQIECRDSDHEGQAKPDTVAVHKRSMQFTSDKTGWSLGSVSKITAKSPEVFKRQTPAR